MKTETIEEIKEMEEGDLVHRIQGKITKAFDRKTGNGQYGEWSVQNCMFRDDTGEMRISIWGKGDVKRSIGKLLAIESVRGEKGWSGMTAVDNEHNGKTTRELKVADSAKVSFVDGAAEPDERPAGHARVRQTQTETRSSAPAQKLSAKPIDAAKQVVAQAADAMDLCLAEAVSLRFAFEAEHGEEAMAPALFQQTVTHLYMALVARGMIDSMPVRPMETTRKEPEPPLQPEPAPKKTESASELDDDNIPF